MKALVLFIGAILLGGACADGADLPAGWKLDRKSGALIHTDSGLEFPPKWNGMLRLPPVTYDPEGLNVSIQYNGPENRLALTLYVYPPDYLDSTDPEEHFKGAVRAAVQTHPGAEIERAVRMELPLGDTTSAGFNAFLRWAMPSGEAGSFVILIPHGERFLKVRASFVMDRDPYAIQKASEVIEKFLRSLDFKAEK